MVRRSPKRFVILVQPMSETVGAILAGGLGTRLRSVVSDRPKVLAAVRGRPFLAYLLDQLAEAGMRRVVLLTGYRSEQIEDEFGDSFQGLKLEYSAETAPLGTAGALRLASPKLFAETAAGAAATADNVLLMNGDSYCAADLAAFRAFHERQAALASLVLTRVEETSRFGRVETAGDRRVERFLEKQAAGGPGWINAGIYLIDRTLVAEIPEGRAVSIEREVFPGWAKRGILRGFPGTGQFLDIGTPESYRAAEDFFALRAPPAARPKRH
jgi:NDP-sugar pyrophosphorylase family protein